MPKKPAKPKSRASLVPETEAIRREIEALLKTEYEGRRVGSYQCGVYAFYDYFGEPIYVGQTQERLGTRTRRHLTNQRTDAVAMGVLDPEEVAEVELWPLELSGRSDEEIKETLACAEYTVAMRVMAASRLKFLLNEKDIAPKREIDLPSSVRRRIVPDPIYEQRRHPDIRIKRRADQIAEIARIVTIRDVSKGLRQTLYRQAVRLETLAKERLEQIEGPIEIETSEEETGDQE